MIDVAGPIAGGGIALVGKIVFDWLKNRGADKNSSAGGNGAGAKSVDYWRMEFRESTREVMEPAMDMLKDIVQSQRAMSGTIGELVLLEKLRQHRS